jgi:hypothetical protein
MGPENLFAIKFEMPWSFTACTFQHIVPNLFEVVLKIEI